MALSTKDRSSIYQRLSPVIGEEETEALLSQFPARDLDEPATKDFVHAEAADIRTEMAEMRTELRASVAGLRADMASLEVRIVDRLREQVIWMAGAMTAGMGLAAGIAAGIASLAG